MGFVNRLEWFFQHEDEATEKASSLRGRGLTVEVTGYVGGYALEISGPPAEMEVVWREIRMEKAAALKPRRILTGTVRWWSDEKGYGRITGDDGSARKGLIADPRVGLALSPTNASLRQGEEWSM